MNRFKDATPDQVDEIMQKAWGAFHIYKKTSLKERAAFMQTIARSIENLGEALVETAMKETHLPRQRLQGEKARMIFQLKNYSEACERGEWLQIRINKAAPEKSPPKPDLRKMLVPLGPVVVFGASNFPFAYSTAGGDTACALAAGCPVVLKAHPAHPETSEMVAQAILKAVNDCGMPGGVFSHLHGAGNETGKSLVTHSYTKAVAFTGSFAGGKALFDWGNQRKDPIPVFAEMGSINPVFLLPEKLERSAGDIAEMYASSITLSVGQFCTNPGLIVGIAGPSLDLFEQKLATAIQPIAPAQMLHPGIAHAFAEKKNRALAQENVTVLTESATEANELQGKPTIAGVNGASFLTNQVLHQEVFGPYSLIVKCKDIGEMKNIADQLEGQLTATIMGSDNEIQQNSALVDAIKEKCGRLILNGVPTGVEVCIAMQHGGPFPATTDSRFTSVGADGIQRFARPVCFQNWSNHLLPDELKDENPLNIWRTVNDEITRH